MREQFKPARRANGSQSARPIRGVKLSVLRPVPIFAGLSDAALGLIHEKSQREEYPSEAVVVREGDSDNHLFIILSGSVRICKNLGAPEETELARLSAGEFFGEMCILDCLPRSASVQTLTKTTVISFSSTVFWKLYEANPCEYAVVILNIARDLSRRLRHLDEKLAGAHKNCGADDPEQGGQRRAAVPSSQKPHG
jgi:CRP/FNR family transcriptional regulator, cyclic AMP receptor protein